MKELQKKDSDKIENVKQVSIEKKKVFLATTHPKANHIMFEVNYKLKTIVRAEFEMEKTLDYSDALKVPRQRKVNVFGKEIVLKQTNIKKLIKKPDCIYVSALNEKNAKKILKRDAGLDLTT